MSNLVTNFIAILLEKCFIAKPKSVYPPSNRPICLQSAILFVEDGSYVLDLLGRHPDDEIGLCHLANIKACTTCLYWDAMPLDSGKILIFPGLIIIL